MNATDSDVDDAGAVPAQLEPMLEKLPADDRAAIVEVFETLSHHSGPICSPSDLERYEAILPGLAERIVRLPEREQEHRHRVVESAIKRDYDLRRRGQTFAMAALMLLLAFSAGLALLGYPREAVAVAIGTIAATVGIFVGGRLVDRSADDVADAG